MFLALKSNNMKIRMIGVESLLKTSPMLSDQDRQLVGSTLLELFNSSPHSNRAEHLQVQRDLLSLQTLPSLLSISDLLEVIVNILQSPYDREFPKQVLEVKTLAIDLLAGPVAQNYPDMSDKTNAILLSILHITQPVSFFSSSKSFFS